MKRTRFAAVLLVSLALLSPTACVQMTKETITANRAVTTNVRQSETLSQSYSEHMHSLNAVVDHDSRALLEDIDMVLLRDRPTRLTQWHEP